MMTPTEPSFMDRRALDLVNCCTTTAEAVSACFRKTGSCFSETKSVAAAILSSPYFWTLLAIGGIAGGGVIVAGDTTVRDVNNRRFDLNQAFVNSNCSKPVGYTVPELKQINPSDHGYFQGTCSCNFFNYFPKLPGNHSDAYQYCMGLVDEICKSYGGGFMKDCFGHNIHVQAAYGGLIIAISSILLIIACAGMACLLPDHLRTVAGVIRKCTKTVTDAAERADAYDRSLLSRANPDSDYGAIVPSALRRDTSRLNPSAPPPPVNPDSVTDNDDPPSYASVARRPTSGGKNP